MSEGDSTISIMKGFRGKKYSNEAPQSTEQAAIDKAERQDRVRQASQSTFNRSVLPPSTDNQISNPDLLTHARPQAPDTKPVRDPEGGRGAEPKLDWQKSKFNPNR